MKPPKFPPLDCPGCQAIADGQALFLLVEQVGEARGVPPMRMLDGIIQLLAMWAPCALVNDGDDVTPIDPDLILLLREVKLATYEAALRFPESLSVEFRQEAERLLAADKEGRHGTH